MAAARSAATMYQLRNTYHYDVDHQELLHLWHVILIPSIHPTSV